MFRKNLAALPDVRLEQKKSVSLHVGLIAFGGSGTDLATGFELTDCAFLAGFLKATCLNAWAKVGAVR